MVDIVIIAVLLLLVAAAVRYLFKRRGQGCCGGCTGCARRKGCPSAEEKGEPK